MPVDTRKAPMGLFNLKKSKNTDDDFEASDEWLMGLAGNDEFDGGPNSTIPQGLASLAPIDDQFGYLEPNHDGSTTADLFAGTTLSGNDGADSEFANDHSGWNFPDLVGDEERAVAEDHRGSELVSRNGVAPDPWPMAAASALLRPSPAADGTGFGSDLFASELDTDDADIADAELDDEVNAYAEPVSSEMVFSGHVETGSGFDRPDVATAAPATDAVARTNRLAPRSHEADLLCEILGVEPGSAWSDLRAAHAAAMSEYDPRLESDEERIALAWAIRREMNSTYATLRLLAAV